VQYTIRALGESTEPIDVETDVLAEALHNNLEPKMNPHPGTPPHVRGTPILFPYMDGRRMK
jgi:hypothetical protein